MNKQNSKITKETDPRMAKNLSSFAKIKVSRKKKVDPKSTYKPKNKLKSRGKKFKSTIDKVKAIYQPKSSKQTDLPPTPHRRISLKNKYLGTVNPTLTQRYKAESMAIDVGEKKKLEPLQLKKKSKEAPISSQKPTSKTKRTSYATGKRNSDMNHINNFVNVFNSFTNDELNKNRKLRRSTRKISDVSSLEDDLTSYKFTRKDQPDKSTARKKSKKLGPKELYQKNRSKSLPVTEEYSYDQSALKRTLSDFAELLKTKNYLAIEFFTGQKVFPDNSQTKPKKEDDTLDESLEKCSSVSSNRSSGKFT